MQFFRICVCLSLLGRFGTHASTLVSHADTPRQPLMRTYRAQEDLKAVLRLPYDKFTEEPEDDELADHQTVPSQVLMDKAGTEKLSTQPAYSPLELNLVDRFRSYAHGASVDMLVAVAVSAFFFGFVAFMVIAPYFMKPSSDTSCTSTAFDQLVDQVEHLVQESATLNNVFGQVEEIVQGDQSDSDSDDDKYDFETSAHRPKFDFETPDPTNDKTKRWQWCTPDEIQQMGILTEAPTKHFEGYKRVDITLTQEGVKGVLSSSNVDLTVFDFNVDGEDLLSKLLRTNAYFMLFGADLASRQVLVMMQTVCLRWVYDGKILLQKSEPKLCLPCQERPCSDSPILTAMQIWQEMFKLPASIVDFVVDSTQDNEIVYYKGLRCVERSHIVDVQLRPLPDAQVVSKVGLPKHADFSSPDPVDGEEVNDFMWMSMDECIASGVKLTDYRVFKPSRRSLILNETGESASVELKSFLDEAGVDVESPIWQSSSRGSSRLEDLAKELSSGKSFITNTSEGLHRCVNVVALRVWSPDRKLMLVEKGHKYASGEEEWNSMLPGIKRRNSESLKEVIWQVLEQQLKLSSVYVSLCDDSDWEYFEYSETSRRYVGLITKYQKSFVDIVLDDEHDLCQRVGLTGMLRSPRRRVSGCSFTKDGVWSPEQRGSSASKSS